MTIPVRVNRCREFELTEDIIATLNMPSGGLRLFLEEGDATNERELGNLCGDQQV